LNLKTWFSIFAGGRSLRPTARTCDRIGSSSSHSDCRHRWRPCRSGRKGCDGNDSDCLCVWQRPVKVGLVASLNRPGGNITGVHLLILAMGAKRLGLLHELVPAANPIGVLTNPNFGDANTQLRDMEEAARSLGLELLVLKASTELEIDAAFSELAQRRIRALRKAEEPAS
jgi:ABC transporter substrate binding protein